MRVQDVLGWVPEGTKPVYTAVVNDINVTQEALVTYINPVLDRGEAWIQRNVWHWPYEHDLHVGVLRQVDDKQVELGFFFVDTRA